MPHPEVDSNHCYECGKEEVRFGSLYPITPIYTEGEGIVNKGAGSASAFIEERNNPPVKFNVDFNVCSKCYIKQFKRRYPEEELPVKITYLSKLDKLNKKFQSDQELEHARAVIARHEEKS